MFSLARAFVLRTFVSAAATSALPNVSVRRLALQRGSREVLGRKGFQHAFSSFRPVALGLRDVQNIFPALLWN